MTSFVTFNVCGIKGILSRCSQWLPERTFEQMFESLKSDVVCFQETKIQDRDITREMAIVPRFNAYFTCSTYKKGYAGVAFYVRDTIGVLYAEEGLSGHLRCGPQGTKYRELLHFPEEMYPEISAKEGQMIDEQGRSLTLDLGGCVVIGLYCPANSQGNMQEYRDKFFELLDFRVTQLQKLGRKVVVMGDLNVAREPQDSAPGCEELNRLKIPIVKDEWMKSSFPRSVVNQWVTNELLVDTTRSIHPGEEGMYTCWDQSKACRPANFGSRIDYILASPELKCQNSYILPNLVGSDHCPVYSELEIEGISPQKQSQLPILAKQLRNRFPMKISHFFKSSGVTKSKKTAKPLVLTTSTKTTSITEILGKAPPKAPLCAHNEPCVLKKSSKPPRKGEHFWTCGRPFGGGVNRSAEFQCKTFIWKNDMKQ